MKVLNWIRTIWNFKVDMVYTIIYWLALIVITLFWMYKK